MKHAFQGGLLRKVLLADAAVSAVAGLVVLLGAGSLAGSLGLPETLLRYAGIALLPYALFVAAIGSRASPPAPATRVVIAVNLLWVLASIALLLSGWVAPTTLGYAFVVAQAAVVAVFGELQYMGLHRPAVAAA